MKNFQSKTKEISKLIDEILLIQRNVDVERDKDKKDKLKYELIEKRLDIDLLLNKIELEKR